MMIQRVMMCRRVVVWDETTYDLVYSDFDCEDGGSISSERSYQYTVHDILYQNI